MKLYITRHGQTRWNQESRIQGWMDSPLTEQGISDAMALARRLEDVHFDYIFSSPLPRAIETATILRNKRMMPILRDPRLKEIRLDEWQGVVFEELQKRHGPSLKAYKADPGNWSFREAETLWDLTERIRLFLKDLPTDGENILIISHGVTIRALKNELTGGDVPHFWDGPSVPGTSLTIAEKAADGWQLSIENCEKHKERGEDNGKAFIG